MSTRHLGASQAPLRLLVATRRERATRRDSHAPESLCDVSLCARKNAPFCECRSGSSRSTCWPTCVVVYMAPYMSSLVSLVVEGVHVPLPLHVGPHLSSMIPGATPTYARCARWRALSCSCLGRHSTEEATTIRRSRYESSHARSYARVWRLVRSLVLEEACSHTTLALVTA